MAMCETSFTSVVVDDAALTANYRRIRKQARTAVMAMVKADAYGHGMVASARAFAQAGCSCFGVAELCEGVALRQAGVAGDILITLGFAAAQAGLLGQHQLTPVIYDHQAAEALSAQAAAVNRTLGVHIKVDTGMGRLGILPVELPDFVAALRRLPGIELAGIMSHLPESDTPQAASTAKALADFVRVCREVAPPGTVLRHIANSGAALHTPEACCDMVRCGIALYGYHPAGASGRAGTVPLVPAMSCTTRILQVKMLPAGVGIGYGHTYRTTRPTKVAVLPTGYQNGYSRALSNRGEVLVRGLRAPLRGRVCMNMCMVDITAIDGVQPGEEVVLLGRQGGEEIDADELAAKIGTISYEVLCMLGNNNTRVHRPS